MGGKKESDWFVPVSTEFIRKHRKALGPAFFTLLAIESHSRGGSECRATDRRLGYVADIPIRSVKEHLDRLDRLGYIERKMIGPRRRIITVKMSMMAKEVKTKQRIEVPNLA